MHWRLDWSLRFLRIMESSKRRARLSGRRRSKCCVRSYRRHGCPKVLRRRPIVVTSKAFLRARSTQGSKQITCTPFSIVGLDTLNLRDDAENCLAGIICEAITNENDSHRSELLKLCLALATRDDSNWSALSPLLQVSLSRKHKRELSPEMRQAALRAIINAEGLQPEWSLFEAAALILFSLLKRPWIWPSYNEQIVALLKSASAASNVGHGRISQKLSTRIDRSTGHQHEYHVQSLLWAILRPVFPGLEDEENLPRWHKHRAQTSSCPASVVIAVRYLREATQWLGQNHRRGGRRYKPVSHERTVYPQHVLSGCHQLDASSRRTDVRYSKMRGIAM